MNLSQETKNALLGTIPSPAAQAEILASLNGGIKYLNVAASALITNTIVETCFDTIYTIPANTLKAGNRIRIRFQGICPATNSTDTLVIKLYLATVTTAGAIVGTTLIATVAQDVANNNVFLGEYDLVIRTIGSAGTMVGVGTYKSIPAAEGTMTIKDDILASTAIDTTVDQKVVLSATWSVADPGNTVRVDILSVDVAL